MVSVNSRAAGRSCVTRAQMTRRRSAGTDSRASEEKTQRLLHRHQNCTNIYDVFSTFLTVSQRKPFTDEQDSIRQNIRDGWERSRSADGAAASCGKNLFHLSCGIRQWGTMTRCWCVWRKTGFDGSRGTGLESITAIINPPPLEDSVF